MQIIELDQSHKQQFDEFIIEQRITRNLDSAWNNISFIDKGRRVFAAVDQDEKFIQVIAVNDMPVRGVGWIYLDTQLSRKVGIKEGKEVTFALLSFVVKTYEKIGTWGFWWIHAGNLKSHIADWDSRFGAHYIKVFEKYNIMDIATVPAGSVTDVPLYDYILKGPLEKDAIVRFAVAWREHALDISANKESSLLYT